jgi:hypothetical protein
MNSRSSQGERETREDRHFFIQTLSVMPEERGAVFYSPIGLKQSES